MNDNIEQVVIHKDPKFHFAEGTTAEILDQMPREVVNSLAEASFTNLTNAKVNSFVSKGVVLKLEEQVSENGTHRVSFRSPSLQGSVNSSNIHPERVKTMEISPKDYTDQRIDALEKSIDNRFDSTEKLLSEKMDHLFSRLEGAIDKQNIKMDGKIELLSSNLNNNIDTKLVAFKEELVKSQKSSRNNIITWTLAGGAIIATIGVAIAQAIFN